MNDVASTAPVAEVFPLPEHIRSAIVEQARREAPRECCGIVSGRDGAPVRLYPTRNIAEGNALYEIDPAELIELEFREMPKQGTELLAIYHSHPVSAAYPSATDVALAYWPGAVYLICSLEDPDRPSIRGFRIGDDVISEVILSS